MADPAIELQQRIAISQAALKTGDADAIRKATTNVIALSLREMAELRMVEKAYAASAELYRLSTAFEDVPQAHVNLGIALLHLNHFDEATQEADWAIHMEVENAAAWKLKGNAAMAGGNYKQGAEALAHALKLNGDVETAYSLAVCFLDLKEPEKARLVFQDMVANYGDSGALHAMFGRAYRDAGDTVQARHEFRRAIELDPKTPHAQYFLALLLLSTNEWRSTPESDQHLAEALKIEPRDFLANYLSGLQASSEKRYGDAQRYLQTASEINPAWPDPWLYMGLNAFDQNDYKTAEPLLRKAIELTGDEESRNNYQIRKAYIDLARILSESGRKEDAKQYFQKARDFQKKTLELSQQTVANVMAEGGASAGMGGVMPLMPKESGVKSKVENSDASDPLPPAAFNQANLTDGERQQAIEEEKFLRSVLGSSFNDLGTAQAHERQFAAALTNFQWAEKWDAEVPGVVRNLGMAAGREGNYQEAVRALSKHLAANPGDNVARAMLGVSLYSTGAYGEAAHTISPLGDIALGDPQLAYTWASSLAKTGEIEAASKILETLEQQQLSPEMMLLIGETWGEVGNYDKAIKELRAATVGNPTLLKAHYGAGLAYLRSDRPAEAAKEFKAELALQPKDLDAEYNLAYAYLQQSQTEDAISLLQQVVAASPEHADALYQLGKCSLDSGKLNDAIGYLERAARSAPARDYIHYQLQAAYRKASRIEDANRELAVYKELKMRNQQRSASHPDQSQ